MKLISFVVPVYNGAKSIEELYHRIVKTCESLELKPEIIFIDDLSKDNSREKLVELKNQFPFINIKFNTENRGQQRTVLEGLRIAKGDYIVSLDDDLEHAPEEVGKLISKLGDDLDLVYGISYKSDSSRSLLRRMGSLLRDLLFKGLFNGNNEIKLSSFRIFSRKLVNKLTDNDFNNSFVYVSAIFMKKEATTGWVYVNGSERKYGKSNYSFNQLIKLYLNIMIYYSNNPMFKIMKFIKKEGESKYAFNDARSGEITG